MEHLSESTLIKLAAGELPSEQRAGWDRHIAECAACRAALSELGAVRELLGAWPVEAGARDVWPALQRRLEQQYVARLVWPRVYRLSRVAAIVVLGVGLGYGSAKLAAVRSAVAPVESSGTGAESSLAGLGFEVIEHTSATGLFAAIDAGSDEAITTEGAP